MKKSFDLETVVFMLGFIDYNQWLQAFEDAIEQSLYKPSFGGPDLDTLKQMAYEMIDRYTLDMDVDEVILKACVNFRKSHPETKEIDLWFARHGPLIKKEGYIK
tara:strand:+ start:507 stop:818 length:312 start_codon:yes stop_codon:yes gene_type:complete